MQRRRLIGLMSPMSGMSLLRTRGPMGLGGLAGATLLAGCGFQLRRPPPMPFARIALQGFEPRSALAEDLRRALREVAQVVAAAPQAQVVLLALQDRIDRSIVASTATGQVRELQLRLQFGFRVATPEGVVLAAPAQLVLARDMSFSETAALAKELEEAQQLREMRADIVGQVMRRLASVRLPGG
ncbi:MAG: LPS assembly lipoprotein LptE [Rubrivivax sp.]